MIIIYIYIYIYIYISYTCNYKLVIINSCVCSYRARKKDSSTAKEDRTLRNIYEFIFIEKA